MRQDATNLTGRVWIVETANDSTDGTTVTARSAYVASPLEALVYNIYSNTQVDA